MKPTSANYPKLFSYALLALFLISCSGGDYSKDRKLKRVVLPAGETHEGWYFCAGDEVVINGTVHGDAYIAGGFVEVDGTINGDLLVAGGQVIVSGTVTDDIRAVGGTLHFNGKVGKNISVAGGNITIGKTGAIDGGLLAACGTLHVVGTIARDAKIAAGDMGVSGTINRNVQFAGGNLSILQGAKIGGDLQALVKEKERVEIAEGSVVGKVDILTREARHVLGFHPWFFWIKILWAGSLLATGLLLVFVFPQQLAGVGSTIAQFPGKSFLWGAAGLILIPIVIILLCITVIGIPIGLFLMTVFLLMAYLTQLSLGVVVGDRLIGIQKKSGWNLFWAFAAGLLIVQALTFVPYLRTLIVLGGLVFGLGAFSLVLKGELQPDRKT